MKHFVMAIVLLASSSVFATPTENDKKILACNKAVERFFSNIQLDGGNSYWGQVAGQKCRVQMWLANGKSLMFLNLSGLTNYYSGIELSPVKQPNVTGISNNLKQCDVTDKSVTIYNVYRMPRTLYFGGDGIGRSPSIFDIREPQTVQLTKNDRGQLVYAKISTATATNTCYFK